VFNLSIGRLDPIKDKSPAGENFLSGAQQRLNNLALGAGHVDGLGGPATEAALRRFQKLCNIDPPEETAGKPIPGPQTLDWLEKIHDRPGKPPPPGGAAPPRQAQAAPAVAQPAPATSWTDKRLEAARKHLEVAQQRHDAAAIEKDEAFQAYQQNRDDRQAFDRYTRANANQTKAKRELDEAKKNFQAISGGGR
jgi:peptidoglycan hydrolase-like protein with peptidoglycan-binding domain